MKKTLALVFLVLLIASYLVGYIPEHRQRQAAETELADLRTRFTQTQGRLRICDLHNRLLSLIERVQEQNYGEAQKLSTEFFDQVRIAANEMPAGGQRSVLETTLQMRDAVTTGLAKGDPASLEALKQSSQRFRQQL